jgi:hypothetical protein
MITSNDLLIEHLARIRVSPKRQNKLTQTERQDFNKTNDNINCDTIESKTLTAYKPINAVAVTPFKPFMASAPIAVAALKPINTTNTIKTNSEPKTVTSLPLKNTVITNSTLNGITSNTSSETDSKFRCHSLLAQFVHRFNDYFVANRLNQTNGWQMVSNEMIKNGFKSYSGVVCKREFNNFISVYCQTLQTVTDYKSACAKYQLFAKLNTMDLWPFMNPNTYAKVAQMKQQKFGIKSKSDRHLVEKQVVLSKKQQNQQNFSKTLQKVVEKNDNKVEESQQINEFINETIGLRSVETLIRESIFTILPNVKQETVDDKESEEVENASELSTNSDSIIKTELVDNCIAVETKTESQNIELPQSAINSVLIACVKRHQKLLNNFGIPLENLWLNVSQNMREFHCPEKYCRPEYCKEQFNNLLSQMVAVLQFVDTVEEARNMFTLFDELSSINLKRFLTKKAIDEIALLRQTDCLSTKSSNH